MHPAWSYALIDVGGSLWGTAVFALAMFAPGYCAGWLTNVCGFRSRGLREQMAWSMALSLGVGTIFLVALVWVVGVAAAGWLLVALTLAAGWMMSRAASGLTGKVDVSRKQCLLAATVFVVWALVVIGSLVDFPHGNGLAMSVTAYDHSVRVAMVGAVMRTGVVPANPLYWPGHSASLRYYYFWYVTCGVVARLAHITARQALIASCVWPMAATGALLALFGRYLLGWSGTALRRRWWIGVALMSVTGLDILMVLLSMSAGGQPDGDMEWWSIDQVTSWADTFLWVPHHAAAMVCSMLCLLLLWMASREVDKQERMKLAALAGLSFASGFGLSNYLGVATAMVAVVWLVWRMFSADRVRALAACAISGLVAAVTLAPYLAQLLNRHGGETRGAGSVLKFGVRMMFTPDLLIDRGWIKVLAVHHAFAAQQISALVLLVPGYFFELGFFGIVLLMVLWRSLRRKENSAGESTLLFWTLAGLACATFVRSQVIETNDFGIRVSLLFQFCLLLLGVEVLERCSRGAKRWLLGFALLGVVGTVFQVVALRLSLPWQEAVHDPDIGGELERRDYVLRDVWAALDPKIPADARVQYDITDNDYGEQARMIQARRQLVAGDGGCGAAFGGEEGPCGGIQKEMSQLFPAQGQRGVEAAQASQLCQAIGAQYLIATRWDPVWQDRQGWVWQLPVVVERPEARVVACATQAR
jgi:hypothetical protein